MWGREDVVEDMYAKGEAYQNSQKQKGQTGGEKENKITTAPKADQATPPSD